MATTPSPARRTAVQSPMSRAYVLGLIAAVIPALLSACQSDGTSSSTLSLEEAKQVTSTFNESFQAPPRTVNDVLAQLSDLNFKPRDCSRAYRISDDEILEAAASLSQLSRAKHLAHHAGEQFRNGDFPRSVKLQRRALDAIPSEIPGYRARNLALLATYFAYGNDFAAAKSAMSRANSEANRVRPQYWKGTKTQYAQFRLHMHIARGAVAAGNGDLAGAEASYRSAMALARESSLAGYDVDFVAMALARNLMRQGRTLEAESAIRERFSLRFGSRYSWSVETSSALLALVRLSEVLYEQGRYAEASALARDTVAIFGSFCASPGNLHLALVSDLLGRALAAQGRWPEVVAQYEAIRENMSKDTESFDRLFSGNLYWALALLRTGRVAQASEQLELAHQRARERLGEKHYTTAELRAYLAMVRSARGDTEGATREFAEVIPVLLRRSRQADEDDTTVSARHQRLKIIMESYIGLLARNPHGLSVQSSGETAMGEAFVLAEHVRSRLVLQALSASGARAALSNPDLADLARREQDAQKQIAALYGTLAEVVSREAQHRDPQLVQALRVKIDTLRDARAALTEEIEARYPDYAELVNPRPVTIERSRRNLHPDEALLVTYIGAQESYVWAVPHSGEAAFAAVPLGSDDLERLVAELRGSLDPDVVTLGDIPEFDVALAHRLYRLLFEPVKTGWQGAGKLLVVADGALGQLPLSLLATQATALGSEKEPLFSRYQEVPWLVRDHAVTVLPSVSSLTTLRSLPAGNSARRAFAGFGDPWFSQTQASAASVEGAGEQSGVQVRGSVAVRGLPVRRRSLPQMDDFDSADLARLPRLPDTGEEVRSIALAMNADLTRDVFTGSDANERQVKTMPLEDYKVVAFATHGLVPGDLNGLTQPALALSAPEVAGVEGDGLLTMAEILGLRLDADWVVLSACNTASGDGAGAEAVSGLGRAFFYSGTRALLVSNWPVETTSAKALTTTLFRRQALGADVDRAQALQDAMLSLIDGPGYVDPVTGKTVFSYAHPIFWAPFTLIGDGGGA